MRPDERRLMYAIIVNVISLTRQKCSPSILHVPHRYADSIASLTTLGNRSSVSRDIIAIFALLRQFRKL